jgi:hypothetical protein
MIYQNSLPNHVIGNHSDMLQMQNKLNTPKNSDNIHANMRGLDAFYNIVTRSGSKPK